MALGYDAIDPFDQPDEIAESVYILTRRFPDERKWRIGQAIVVGESDVPCCQIEPLSKDQYPSSIPAIFVDFNQGCLRENAERILGFMEGRRYTIRTPDPRKHAWAALRKRGLQPGRWFSPLQDMFDGALSFAGTGNTSKSGFSGICVQTLHCGRTELGSIISSFKSILMERWCWDRAKTMRDRYPFYLCR